MILDGFNDVRNANAVSRVLEAYEKEGREVWRQWPMMGLALEALQKTYKPPVFGYQLNVAWFVMNRLYKEVKVPCDTLDGCFQAQSQIERNKKRGFRFMNYHSVCSIAITLVGYEEGHNA